MILSCQHLSKSFLATDILRDASFVLEEHEKAAIVGINGAGKSTLLKIIVGELPADQGQVVLAHGKTLGYLAQQQMLTGHQSIYQELREAKRAVIEAEDRLRTLEREMKHASGEALDQIMHQYHTLSEWFEQQNGYALESEITGVLKGLGFAEEDFQKSTDTLSGGQKTRVALGKLLLSSPDLILLDEPTNHLDINSISWLENYLKTYRGAVIIVAHDRYFLNKIVSKVIEIDQGQVRTFHGNYSDYAARKKQLRETALKAWMNQQREIKHQEEVIAKLRSFNREKSIRRAESREKMLEKIDRMDRPMEADTQIRLSLTPRITSGNDVLQVESLSKSFGAQRLFQKISFQIRRGERVALIGDNGTGKTTLLKIINGLTEADQGSITLGSKVVVGYYDQDHQVLHPEKTLFEEISDAYPELTNTRIRNVLAAFLFTGYDVYKRIKELSGGERGRVSLAKLMLSNANFLILDEPTNHLDIYSKEILEDALREYTGTVFYVSHDRYFINRTCSRILELTEHTLVSYLGDYDYYLEKRAELSPFDDGLSANLVGSRPSGKEVPGTEPAENASAAPPASKESWLKAKEAQARERKRQSDLRRTEEEITACEQEDKEIDALLAQEAVFTDADRVRTLTVRKAELSARLETLYEVWETLAE